MEITSRPTSSFCRPGQEQLRLACGLGGKGAGGTQVEQICYFNISISPFVFLHPMFRLGYAIFLAVI